MIRGVQGVSTSDCADYQFFSMYNGAKTQDEVWPSVSQSMRYARLRPAELIYQ